MFTDISIFQYINGFAGRSAALDFFGIFLAAYLQYVLGAVLLVLLFWPKKELAKNRLMVTMGLAAALAARWIVKTLIVLAYARPRPFVFLPAAHKLIPNYAFENFQSFPSGHMLFFFALSTVLFAFNKKLGSWFFAASAIMGVARIFAGMHWPSDILIGAMLGVLVGALTYKACMRYKSALEKTIAKMFEKTDRKYTKIERV
jgi:undecaprenyl-diphosphatase